MPKFTKLTDEEVQKITATKSKSSRNDIYQSYIDELKTFNVGDWVNYKVSEGAKRQTEKNRLIAVSKKMGKKFEFKRPSKENKGNIVFQIQEGEPEVA